MVSKRLTCIVVLWTLLCAYLPAFACAQSKTAQRKVSPLALAESVRLNNMGLNSCDALIRISNFADKGAAGHEDGIRHSRLLMDFAAERCLFCSLGQFKKSEADEKGVVHEIGTELRCATLITDKQVDWREWPRGAVHREHEGFMSAFGERDIPGFGFVGVWPYPMKSGPYYSPRVDHPLADPERFWGFIKLLWSAGTVREHDKEIDLLVPYPGKQNQEAPITVVEITFDRETQIPTRRKVIYEHKGKRIPQSNDFFKWVERNGVTVPAEIYSDERQSMYLLGKPFFYERTTLIEIHWFSVNEPLDPRHFDLGVLSDPQRVTQLTDPKSSGAKSLIKSDGTKR